MVHSVAVPHLLVLIYDVSSPWIELLLNRLGSGLSSAQPAESEDGAVKHIWGKVKRYARRARSIDHLLMLPGKGMCCLGQDTSHRVATKPYFREVLDEVKFSLRAL